MKTEVRKPADRRVAATTIIFLALIGVIAIVYNGDEISRNLRSTSSLNGRRLQLSVATDAYHLMKDIIKKNMNDAKGILKDPQAGKLAVTTSVKTLKKQIKAAIKDEKVGIVGDLKGVTGKRELVDESSSFESTNGALKNKISLLKEELKNDSILMESALTEEEKSKRNYIKEDSVIDQSVENEEPSVTNLNTNFEEDYGEYSVEAPEEDSEDPMISRRDTSIEERQEEEGVMAVHSAKELSSAFK